MRRGRSAAAWVAASRYRESDETGSRHAAHRRGAGRRERRDARRCTGDTAGRQRVVAGGRSDAGAPAWQHPAYRWGYPSPSLSQATTSSLPALKAYLAGEREYRTAKWSDAVRHYHRAVEADSNFASAWFRLSSACGWWAGCPTELGRAISDESWSSRISSRIGKRSGFGRSSCSTLTPWRVDSTYPDDIEAWVALEKGYHHVGGVTLRSTKRTGARSIDRCGSIPTTARIRAPDRGCVSAPRQS